MYFNTSYNVILGGLWTLVDRTPIMSTSDLVPHTAKSPPDGFAGWRIRGGRHIEGWAGPANCGILIRNPLPLNSKPISCTQAIYFGRVIHGTNLTHFDADIHSLIWFASTEIAIKNLKSENGLGLCRPNESDRETDRK